MNAFTQFWKDLFAKDFWSFALSSKTKKIRLVLVTALVLYAIYACITELPTTGWKIGGSVIAVGWWLVNAAQLYSSYYRVTYKLKTREKE